MIFGIAGEGKTDQVTIKAIIKGFYKKPSDLDVSLLQPRQGATEEAMEGFGSWTNLLHYLESTRFRDDLMNVDALVIQIDTDVSEEDGFDVPKLDAENGNIPFTVEELAGRVTKRLIDQIESGLPGFYSENSSKIVFAISVHSLECWIFSYYRKQEKSRIMGCEDTLNMVLTRYHSKSFPNYEKCPKIYEKLSKPFLKASNINIVRKDNESFELFLKQLELVEYIEDEFDDW